MRGSRYPETLEFSSPLETVSPRRHTFPYTVGDGSLFDARKVSRAPRGLAPCETVVRAKHLRPSFLLNTFQYPSGEAVLSNATARAVEIRPRIPDARRMTAGEKGARGGWW